jgi:hypothetical protein
MKSSIDLQLYRLFFRLYNILPKKALVINIMYLVPIIDINIHGTQTLSSDLFFFETITMSLFAPVLMFLLIRIFRSIIIELKDRFAIYQASGVRAPDFLRAMIKKPGFRQTLAVVVTVAGWGYYRFEVAATWLTALLGRGVYSFPVEASLLVITLVWYFCWSERAIMLIVVTSLVIGELIPSIYSPQREMPASFAYFVLVWMIVRYLLECVVASVSRWVRPSAIADPRDINLRPVGSDDLGNRTRES